MALFLHILLPLVDKKIIVHLLWRIPVPIEKNPIRVSNYFSEIISILLNQFIFLLRTVSSFFAYTMFRNLPV